MKIQPRCDVSIEFHTMMRLVKVVFARIPDSDVVADVYSIVHDNPGIFMPDDEQRLYGEPPASKPQRNRLCYMFSVPSTYDPAGLARTVGYNLKEVHGLSVVVIDEDHESGGEKARILKL